VIFITYFRFIADPFKAQLILARSCTYFLALFTPPSKVKSLYYASAVWFKCSKNIENQINKVIRSAARFVLGKRKFDSISLDIVRELGWLDCKFKCKFEVVKIAYKLLNNVCPEYFHNYLVISNPTVRTTRSKQYFHAQTDSSSLYGSNSFKYFASHSWCNIPDQLKSDVSFNVFKNNVFQLFKTELQDILLMRNVPDVCNLSCIDSVLNYFSDDDDIFHHT
jgi:hypothetical protein